MKSRTEKLAKGRGYPLRPSFLAAAVEASGIDIPVQLTRWDRFDHAFQVDFMPNGFPKQAEHELFWVHCRAVPAHRAGEARQVIENEAIPRFLEWARNIDGMDASSTIRRENQTFRYSLADFAS